MDTKDILLAAFKDKGALTKTELGDATDRTPSAIARALPELIAGEWVARVPGTGGRGGPAKYAIPGTHGATRSTQKKRGGKVTKAPRAYKRTAAKPAPAATFTPALITGRCLALFGPGGAPQVFTAEQTCAIADLITEHWSADEAETV